VWQTSVWISGYQEGTSSVRTNATENSSRLNISIFYNVCYNDTPSRVVASVKNKVRELPRSVVVTRFTQFGFEGYIDQHGIAMNGGNRTVSRLLTVSWKAYYGEWLVTGPREQSANCPPNILKNIVNALIQFLVSGTTIIYSNFASPKILIGCASGWCINRRVSLMSLGG